MNLTCLNSCMILVQVFLVAEDEGYVVGYVLFWIKYENEGHIISLAVDKDYQRKKSRNKVIIKSYNCFIII